MLNKLFKTNAAHATILLKKIISLAVNQGFIGFGGKCGQAAIAMNHVLFDNTLSYVGIFNKALAEEGYTIGHIALEFDSKTSLLLDIDGIASIETLEHWGMLDVTDSDIIDLYAQFDLMATDEHQIETHSHSVWIPSEGVSSFMNVSLSKKA